MPNRGTFIICGQQHLLLLLLLSLTRCCGDGGGNFFMVRSICIHKPIMRCGTFKHFVATSTLYHRFSVWCKENCRSAFQSNFRSNIRMKKHIWWHLATSNDVFVCACNIARSGQTCIYLRFLPIHSSQCGHNETIFQYSVVVHVLLFVQPSVQSFFLILSGAHCKWICPQMYICSNCFFFFFFWCRYFRSGCRVLRYRTQVNRPTSQSTTTTTTQSIQQEHKKRISFQ